MSHLQTQVDYRTFALHGSHYTIGQQLGQLSPQFSLPSWYPQPPDMPFAAACATEIALAHPPLLDEIQGYADGQGQPYEDFLRIICRQRLSGRIPAPERGGCTSFAWRASNGHILVGRNYDFYPLQHIRQRIHNYPEDGYRTIGMRGSVPVGRYDGINEKGLFVSLHVVIADAPTRFRPGIPFHLIPRLILETCADVSEALHALMLLPHMHSFNYLLADTEGFAVVEAHHDNVKIIRAEDVIAVSNFYQHPQMKPLQGRRKPEIPIARAAFLREYVTQPHDDPFEATKIAMRDRTAPICGLHGQHTTLWSCVVDLTGRRLAYAKGAPSEVDYEELAWI